MLGDQQQQHDVVEEDSDIVQVEIPRVSAVAIHFPGYIRNPDRALETLGGEAALSTALQNNPSLLRLRLRPADQHSHPLFGARQAQQGLVLRISRPHGQPDAEPKVTVAAMIQASYSFDGLADYQFVGADSLLDRRELSHLAGNNAPAAAEPFRTPQPFLLVPHVFSRIDVPVAFAFRDQAPAKESEPDVLSRKRIVSFYEANLPPALPLPSDYVPAQASQQPAASGEQLTASFQQVHQQQPSVKQQVLQTLQDLLAARPAWPLELLLDEIPGSTQVLLQPLLHALCYQFKTGPWKQLYLRCGFDPRASLEGRAYQQIAYRWPMDWSKAVKAAKAAGHPMKPPTLKQLHSFSAMPISHTTHLQLTDLHDEAIQQLISLAPVPPGPSEAYGWFTYASSQQLQQAVSMAFSKTLKRVQEQLRQQQGQECVEQQQDPSGTCVASMDVEQPTAPAAVGSHVPAVLAGANQGAVATTAQAAAAPAAAVPASAADCDGGATELLGGLSGASEELQQWLAEEAAAAAEQRQRQRQAAAAGAGISDAESTDAGLSESDWATSVGETTADEGIDADEFDEHNEDV